MTFLELDPRTVEPSPWNTNTVSHENETKLRTSIERLGMFKPIIVRQVSKGLGRSGWNIQCIGGWHRCEQAIELGYASIPAFNVGEISDEKAKEISLADNARYGLDDTLKLSGLLEELDTEAIEGFMPWTQRDIEAMTASIAVNIDDLEIDPIEPDEDDEPQEAPAPKAVKTHQLMKFRVPLGDAARISLMVSKVMKDEGFTDADDMTNAGEALAHLLLSESDDANADV